MSRLAERIAAVHEEIAETARAAGRDPSSIALLGVTKAQPRTAVEAAIGGGLTDIGENYLQEAREKYAGLTARKHFIGHVQTNKARAIVETFDVVQSIDRFEAGRAIGRAQRATGKRVRTLLQVNISPTERFGIGPGEAPALAARLRADEGLDVDGVMAIGPVGADRATLLRAFACAARVFADVGGSTLSLGMSGDWREAVACGSTMVRLGTALFGARG
jgi:pyridoxal phosphate enzyme (YggS family)